MKGFLKEVFNIAALIVIIVIFSMNVIMPLTANEFPIPEGKEVRHGNR